jgi:hypothetical protein
MAPSLKGAALNATRTAIFGANHAAKELLKRLDAFDSVRRALRSRAKKKAEQALDARVRRGGQANDPGKSGQQHT